MPPEKRSISKILRDEAPEDRKIRKFPPPYNTECTPYKKIEFSKFTREKCFSEVKYNDGNWLKICKIIIIGDVSVGKTSILNRFCRKFFETNYKTTIGVDFEVERFDILDIAFNLQIWDTAGQERFKSIAQSYYRGAHVIIIVFDLTNAYSLSNCEKWLKETSLSVSKAYIFLVGTKRDILSKFAFATMESKSIAMAKKLNAEYWTVSSKTGKNIDELFSRIAALTFDDYIMDAHALKESNVNIGKSVLDLGYKKQSNPKSCISSRCK